jgi:hypothetical protein
MGNVTIRRERNLYEWRKGRLFFHKTWNDRMKGKKEKRKKGFKPPFLKKKSQEN